MPYDLKGRRVLVTAGSRGLGALVAKRFGAEGCDVVVNYVSNKEAASEVVKSIQQSGSRASAVQGDAGDVKVCEELVASTVETLGGIDIVISNAGYTKKSAFGDLHGNTDEEWDKCWQVNVKAQMALCRAAIPQFNSNPEGGVFLMTSSVAGVTQSGSSMPYSVTKAAGLHLMKCMASTQGPKVRINAVLPGLLLTDWGRQAFTEDQIKALKERAVLKKTADLDDTADAFIMLAKNASMTGMKIQVDGGLAPHSM